MPRGDGRTPAHYGMGDLPHAAPRPLPLCQRPQGVRPSRRTARRNGLRRDSNPCGRGIRCGLWTPRGPARRGLRPLENTLAIFADRHRFHLGSSLGRGEIVPSISPVVFFFS